MKLGDKVVFSKSLNRTRKMGFDRDLSTIEEDNKELLREEEVNVKFWDATEHKKMTGLVVGKRRISTSTSFEIFYNDFSGEEYLNYRHEFESVYLVACNLVGFKRVRLEDLELLE